MGRPVNRLTVSLAAGRATSALPSYDACGQPLGPRPELVGNPHLEGYYGARLRLGLGLELGLGLGLGLGLKEGRKEGIYGHASTPEWGWGEGLG